MILIAYLPALYAGFVWDDSAITESPLLQGPGGLRMIWSRPGADPAHEIHYWPLSYTVLWAENALWGLKPFGYHLVNVLLHAANTVLLWLLLRRLKAPGAWLAAAIFALHPVHVQSVAWAIEIKDVLSALLYLLAFHAFLQFQARPRPLTCAALVALFACALLSKSVAVSLPLALGLCLWWKQGRLTVRDGLLLAPMLAMGAIIAGLDGRLATHLENYSSELNWAARLALAGRALWFYGGKLICPLDLMAIYPRWDVRASHWAAWAGAAAAGAALIGLWSVRRAWGRGPLAAVLFFALTLGPILGFVDFGYMTMSFVADRFQYLASIGIIALLAAGVEWAACRLSVPGRRRLRAVVLAWLAILGILTWRQATLFKDEETLFRENVARNPNAWGAMINLGRVLAERGSFYEALDCYDQALATNPNDARAYANRGAALHCLGRVDEAIECYKEALRLWPGVSNVRQNLGAAYLQKGQAQAAIQCYAEAAQLQPNNALAHYSLGLALCQAGQTAKAAEEFRSALRIQPNYAEARENLKALGAEP